MPARKKTTITAPRKKTTVQATGKVAASFNYSAQVDPFGGQNLSRDGYLARRYKTIKAQKFRNNYLTMGLRDIAGICRIACERNWFLSPVIDLRKSSQMDGFKVLDPKGKPVKTGIYDFHSLADDVFAESLTTSNAIAIWRKNSNGVPHISILNTENTEYQNIGGVEILRVYCQKMTTTNGRLSQPAIDAITDSLGEKMTKAQINGGWVEIVKGRDEEWDFELMSDGARNVCVKRPVIESILDPLDFLDLMEVGDWNLAWFRKDVIRQVKKGYKGTGGQGTLGGVDVTTGQIKQLGEGMKKINGNANVPTNHDVDFSYHSIAPEFFDPKQIEAAVNKIMLFGGVEAAVLLGNFSQQDGAAPTLMRHARVAAWGRRDRVARFLNRIFARAEFDQVTKAVRGGEFRFEWSDRTLYSVDELLSKVSKTADGVLSTRSRREILDIDNDREVTRLKLEHKDREGYAPSFEAKQGLLSAMFEDLRDAKASGGSGDGGVGGRPVKDSQI